MIGLAQSSGTGWSRHVQYAPTVPRGAGDVDVFLRVKRGPVWIIIAEDDCVFWRFRYADGDDFR